MYVAGMKACATNYDRSSISCTQPMIDHEHPRRFLSLLNMHIVVFVADEREENMCILEEAAAIKYVCKQLVLIGQQGGGGSGGETAEKKEVVVVLLAELLLEQDREVAAILNKLPHMVRDEICILGWGLQSQSLARAINP